MVTDCHAEHVGSLLRPAWLLEARSRYRKGELAAEALREAEDRAALEAIELQRQAAFDDQLIIKAAQRLPGNPMRPTFAHVCTKAAPRRPA